MIIQVNPTLLQNKAQQIQGIGEDIFLSVKELAGIIENAPSYEGQFGPKIVSLWQESSSRASRLSRSLDSLGERLFAKGVEFEAVDNEAITKFENIFNVDKFLESLSKLTSIPIDILERFLNLGTLFSSIGIFGLFNLTPIVVIPQQQKKPLPNSPSPLPTELPDSSPQQLLSVKESQKDPAWAMDSMGSNGTLEEYGCLVTALTMLARFDGVDITPKDFNKWLQEHDGYVDGSNLVWGKAQEYLNSILHTDNSLTSITGPNAINTELNAGHPVILHVPGPTEDGHYVLAVPPPGNNNTFTAFDPWTGEKSTYAISQVKGARSF